MTPQEFAEGVIGIASPPAGVFLVARLDGSPVGCGGVVPLDPDQRVGEVRRMFVEVPARGLGLSRRLLGMLEGEAAALGFRRLQLATGVRQPEAISLYRSAGWTEIDSYGIFAGDPLSLCFGKDVSALQAG